MVVVVTLPLVLSAQADGMHVWHLYSVAYQEVIGVCCIVDLNAFSKRSRGSR